MVANWTKVCTAICTVANINGKHVQCFMFPYKGVNLRQPFSTRSRYHITTRFQVPIDVDEIDVKINSVEPKANVGIEHQNTKAKSVEKKIDAVSTHEMLSFALPALGIFLSAPLLSNIDNAFVGRTSGTTGLASLSPATICTDQMLYLFSFLSRATTGIVSRAYATSDSKGEHNEASSSNGNNEIPSNILKAQTAASTPLTVALLSGVGLSIFYALFTPNMLKALDVDPSLRSQAAQYIYWRGSISWAALAQSVSLSVMLATRDAISPLKIIGLAVIVNVFGDALLCVYPFRCGCVGAGAATAFATLFSSFFMLKGLAEKNLLPKISIPKRHELKELFDYVGPLFAITITRLLGFTSMQRAAMRCGVQSLAAYQICSNCLIFFLLFGEPLSQLHQNRLPSLIDKKDESSIFSTMKSVLKLGCFTALTISAIALMALTFGTSFFTTDQAVTDIIVKTAPAVAIGIASAILGVTIDGAMLASRDFSFILVVGILTCFMQLSLVSRCSSLTGIFSTFALRLTTYSVAAIVRIGSGSGTLGKLLWKKKK